MLPRRYKPAIFALTAVNTVASTLFFNYLFFYLRDQFGFDTRANLWVSALHGAVYVVAAWQGGRFAQRRGYLTSLKTGYAGLAALMLAGGFISGAAGLVLLVGLYTLALLLTWPALEALATEGENRPGIQRMVGFYNCAWASSAAVAFFFGGKLYDLDHRLGLFWLPSALFAAQFVAACWLGRRAVKPAAAPAPPEPAHPEPAAYQQAVRPQTFLKMAWLANPFAYVAINTLFATMPALAERLGLSATEAGWFGSVWLFARLAAFAGLWRWSGWHYRFRWLLAGFVSLLASFVTIVLAPALWMAVVAQLAFGAAAGLAYYASLFYSMDVGTDTKGEHGGLHEAAIGAGIFGGPAIGALALTLAPAGAHAATWAVGGLLAAGLAALLWLRARG